MLRPFLRAPLRSRATTLILKNNTRFYSASNDIAVTDPEEYLTEWNRPLPVNVRAIYHAPLKIPAKYNDHVATLTFRSYDNENLELFTDFILRVGYYLGVPMTGPKPMPTRRERWTVIRSPFAQSKSKENFERSTHSRMIKCWDSNMETIDMLIGLVGKYGITGVGVKCNVFDRVKLNDLLKEDEGIKETQFERTLKQTEDINDPVSKRVVELLKSPEFQRYFNKEENIEKPEMSTESNRQVETKSEEDTAVSEEKATEKNVSERKASSKKVSKKKTSDIKVSRKKKVSEKAD